MSVSVALPLCVAVTRALRVGEGLSLGVRLLLAELLAQRLSAGLAESSLGDEVPLLQPVYETDVVNVAEGEAQGDGAGDCEAMSEAVEHRVGEKVPQEEAEPLPSPPPSPPLVALRVPELQPLREAPGVRESAGVPEGLCVELGEPEPQPEAASVGVGEAQKVGLSVGEALPQEVAQGEGEKVPEGVELPETEPQAEAVARCEGVREAHWLPLSVAPELVLWVTEGVPV